MNGAFSSPRRVAAVVLTALTAVVAAGAGGCRALRDPVRPGPFQPPLSPGFAGTAACAGCHPRETAAHRASGHAATLQPVNSALGRRLPPSGWVRDPALPVMFRIQRRDGVLGVEVRAGDIRRWQPAHWLFGSGRHGVTLVAAAGAGRYLELPLS